MNFINAKPEFFWSALTLIMIRSGIFFQESRFIRRMNFSCRGSARYLIVISLPGFQLLRGMTQGRIVVYSYPSHIILKAVLVTTSPGRELAEEEAERVIVSGN